LSDEAVLLLDIHAAWFRLQTAADSCWWKQRTLWYIMAFFSTRW